MANEYRIEYTITKSDDGFETEEEVGFGSSGTWGSIDDCLNMVEADIQNECWETPIDLAVSGSDRAAEQ